MLSRYQIKSTQLPKPSAKSIESNMPFTLPSTTPTRSHPYFHAAAATCTQFKCSSYTVNVKYTHTYILIHKTLLYSLHHPIAPTKHKHSTQWVVPTVYTHALAFCLPLEIWMMILFHIHSTINNNHNSNNNNSNNEIHGLSKMWKLNRYGWQWKPHIHTLTK